MTRDTRSRHPRQMPTVYDALPAEREPICEFTLRFPKIGYRKLTWMMVDAGIVCVEESKVCRVLTVP